ncbi:MAG: hypothetical protein M3122_02525, partial [Actinomycetota bacterium]|nr:hypothetical protein [Actinomycetota bacterium]
MRVLFRMKPTARGAYSFRWVVVLMLALALLLSAGQGPLWAQASSPSEDSVDDADSDGDVDGEILVKFEPGTSEAKKDETHGQKGGRVKERIRKPDSKVAPDIQVVRVNGDEEAKAEDYEADAEVQYAEPNFIYKPTATTANDTKFSELYGLHNTG